MPPPLRGGGRAWSQRFAAAASPHKKARLCRENKLRQPYQWKETINFKSHTTGRLRHHLPHHSPAAGGSGGAAKLTPSGGSAAGCLTAAWRGARPKGAAIPPVGSRQPAGFHTQPPEKKIAATVSVRRTTKFFIYTVPLRQSHDRPHRFGCVVCVCSVLRIRECRRPGGGGGRALVRYTARTSAGFPREKIRLWPCLKATNSRFCQAKPGSKNKTGEAHPKGCFLFWLAGFAESARKGDAAAWVAAISRRQDATTEASGRGPGGTTAPNAAKGSRLPPDGGFLACRGTSRQNYPSGNPSSITGCARRMALLHN